MTWPQARTCELHFQMSGAWPGKTGLPAEKYTENKPKGKKLWIQSKSKFTGLSAMVSPFLLNLLTAFPQGIPPSSLKGLLSWASGTIHPLCSSSLAGHCLRIKFWYLSVLSPTSQYPSVLGIRTWSSVFSLT